MNVDVSIREDGDDLYVNIETAVFSFSTSLDNLADFLDAYEKDNHRFVWRGNPFVLVEGELTLFMVEEPGVWENPEKFPTSVKIALEPQDTFIATLQRVYKRYKEGTESIWT